ERHRRKLRDAFGCYVPIEIADAIARSGFDLAPGGKKIVATIVFTDIAGFTELSENLNDSEKLGNVLTEYFTKTTTSIFDQNGTVIKFIGDAVLAVWGAPLPQPDQAERAVRAAGRLARIASMEVTVPKPDGPSRTINLRTRIGVHTGEALAGNL